MERLTAVIPATNSPSTLDRCVAAIRAAVDSPEEILVVDGPPGAGPAEARNAGARRAAGDVLVFVDADVVVHADAFTRIRTSLGSRPGLAAVFGSYDDAPPGTGVVSAFRNLLHHHVHQGAPGLASTFWAGLGAVRRDDFEAVGGFDEVHYRVPSIEDVELGMRLVEAGSWIELDPGLQGTHLKRWTLVEMVRTDFSRRGIPWVMLLLRRGHGSSALNLGWRHRLSALACLAAVGAAAARRPGLAGTATLAFVSLNLPFYRLLLRRQGPLEATAGVGLHALHHLVGIAALPVGVVRYLLENRGVEPLGVATDAVSSHTEESFE